MKHRCAECASTNLLPKKLSSAQSWRDFEAIKLKNPPEVLTCTQCGKPSLKLSDYKKIDLAIQETITSLVNEFLAVIISRHSTQQIDIARRLGTSPEYLSEIKSGRKLPSFHMFNQLKVFALLPQAFELANPNIIEATYEKLEIRESMGVWAEQHSDLEIYSLQIVKGGTSIIFSDKSHIPSNALTKRTEKKELKKWANTMIKPTNINPYGQVMIQAERAEA